MILTCPACGTQYVVKDGAIPEGGRKVRCAACRHSWHQDPEQSDEPLELEEPVEPDTPPPSELAPATGEQERWDDFEPADGQPGDPDDLGSADELAENPVGPDDGYAAPIAMSPSPDGLAAFGSNVGGLEQPVEQVQAPDEADDDFSPFAERSAEPRRGSGPLVAILLVVLVVAALAAAFWFLAPPEWKARVGLAAAAQTPLQLMMTHSDRQALASGNELLAVSGRVINPTRKAQRVPPIQAELRSSSGEVVYRWTIAPPTSTLAPGASARFNSAEVNVPSGGEELTVSLGSPGA